MNSRRPGSGEAADEDALPSIGLIRRVREYTKAREELRKAHHFTFDLPLGNETPTCVVMGMNPGEIEEDFRYHPGPTEETRAFDFHAIVKPSRGALRWRSTVRDICGAASSITEAFFWSSPNLEAMVPRFGTTLRKSPHLKFCRDINMELIAMYSPQCIVLPGLGMESVVARLYGLEEIETIRCPTTNHRLVVTYCDSERTWLFTKHWTGSRGFSSEQRVTIRSAVQAQLGGAVSP